MGEGDGTRSIHHVYGRNRQNRMAITRCRTQGDLVLLIERDQVGAKAEGQTQGEGSLEGRITQQFVTQIMFARALDCSRGRVRADSDHLVAAFDDRVVDLLQGCQVFGAVGTPAAAEDDQHGALPAEALLQPNRVARQIRHQGIGDLVPAFERRHGIDTTGHAVGGAGCFARMLPLDAAPLGQRRGYVHILARQDRIQRVAQIVGFNLGFILP